jgi:hypothetical protein
MTSGPFSYRRDKPKWLEERERERERGGRVVTPNSHEMYDTLGDPNICTKHDSLVPTDDIVVAVCGLSYILSKITQGLYSIKDNLGLFLTVEDRATDEDYKRAEALPLYEHGSKRQRLRALDKIVREREHFSKQ